MNQNDFYDFEDLKTRCTIRKPKNLNFSEGVYYHITKDFSGYRMAVNYGVGQRQLGLGEKVNWAKGRQQANSLRNDPNFNLNVPLKQKYNAPLALKKKKLDDLKSFVPELVPVSAYNEYWHAILSADHTASSSDDDDDFN